MVHITKYIPILLFVFTLLLILTGCTEPIQYGDISTGMDSYELLSLYPDVEELPDVIEEKAEMQVYKRTPGGDKKVEYYFLTDNSVTTIIIIFSKDADYNSIADELTFANGPSTVSTGRMGGQVTVWGENKAAITLSKTPLDMPIDLPGGGSEAVEKGEIFLIVDQQIDRFGYVWYITAMMIGLMLALNIAVTIKTGSTTKQLRNVIRSRKDLALIKEIINLSMMLAVVVIIAFAAYAGILIYFAFIKGMGFIAAMNHLFVFGVITLPIGLYCKSVEKKIKTLAVEADDPEIKETYELWLSLWDKPGFKLPE